MDTACEIIVLAICGEHINPLTNNADDYLNTINHPQPRKTLRSHGRKWWLGAESTKPYSLKPLEINCLWHR